MDRAKKKSKKPLLHKTDDNHKSSSFNQDLKTIKENLRISEILRNVKISSSFRIKGPKGTKVITDSMHDIEESHVIDESNDHDGEIVENDNEKERQHSFESISPSPDIESDRSYNIDQESESFDRSIKIFDSSVVGFEGAKQENGDDGVVPANLPIHECKATTAPTGQSNVLEDMYEGSSTLSRLHNSPKQPSRKLSLDNTMLRRRESISKSEMDLNLVGRPPLQRKSSFFRKKLDSLVKNTSEVFKRQVSMSQSTDGRRDSKSYSLQSLTDRNVFLGDVILDSKPKAQLGSSGSVSAATGSAVSLADSQRSPPDSSVQGSVTSLNELCLNDAILSGRAYSVSSGLDTVHQPRRTSSRNNRFTWLASDTVAEYLRRKVEDELGARDAARQCDLHASQSFQSAAPLKRLDSKGRRLSYQRAVSGEDPVLPSRQHDGSLRRRRRALQSAECIAVSALLSPLPQNK